MHCTICTDYFENVKRFVEVYQEANFIILKKNARKVYLSMPMTKPENFLKSSSEENLVFNIITRSQFDRWAGPA